MTGDRLPDTDWVSRYCRPRQVLDGEPLPAAFMPRNGEEYLSVNWLEYFSAPASADRINQVRETMQSAGFRLSRNGLFAALQIGLSRAEVKDKFEVDIEFVHEPLPSDGSHAGIYGLPVHDYALLSDVATCLAHHVTDQGLLQRIE